MAHETALKHLKERLNICKQLGRKTICSLVNIWYVGKLNLNYAIARTSSLSNENRRR